MRKLNLVLVALGAAASVGCSRPYHMDAQAVPSPFTRAGCRAQLEPIHTEQLLVGSMPENVYVANKQDKSAESYMVDKQESANLFQQSLVEDYGFLFQPGGDPANTFIIRPTWTHWEPGSVFGWRRKDATADFLVEVLTAQGQLLDRFDFETAVTASIYNPSSGGRMRSALKKAGHIIGRYLGDNWLCAQH